MGTIVPSVRHAAPGEEIRIGGVVTYVALWHGAVGYIDLVVATDGRRYAVRVASPHTGGARRWTAVRRYVPRPACGAGADAGAHGGDHALP